MQKRVGRCNVVPSHDGAARPKAVQPAVSPSVAHSTAAADGDTLILHIRMAVGAGSSEPQNAVPQPVFTAFLVKVTGFISGDFV